MWKVQKVLNVFNIVLKTVASTIGKQILNNLNWNSIVFKIESDVQEAKKDFDEAFDIQSKPLCLKKYKLFYEEGHAKYDKLDTASWKDEVMTEIVEDKLAVVNRRLTQSQHMDFYKLDVKNAKSKKGIDASNFNIMYRRR